MTRLRERERPRVRLLPQHHGKRVSATPPLGKGTHRQETREDLRGDRPGFPSSVRTTHLVWLMVPALPETPETPETRFDSRDHAPQGQYRGRKPALSGHRQGEDRG